MTRASFSTRAPDLVTRGARARWAEAEALKDFNLFKLLAYGDPGAMRVAERLHRADAAGRVHAQAELCAAAGGHAAHGRERRAAAAVEEAGGGRRKRSAARKVKEADKLRARWVRKRCDAAVAAVGGVKLGRVLACMGTFVLQLRRLRAARVAATEAVAAGGDVAAAVVPTAVAAADDAAMGEPLALAPAPALTSVGEEPPVGAPGDVGGRTWAGVAAAPPAAAPAAPPAAAPAPAPAASPEKRRVEFDAEQSPAQRGRPVADGGREREERERERARAEEARRGAQTYSRSERMASRYK